MACATLPYLNILFNGFVYDDDSQVMHNPYVRSFQHLKEIFTTHVWSFRGLTSVGNYYRPMMTLGYLFCYKLFGMRAYGFHLVSLLLHVLIVCLVFVLTERLTGDRVWAFVAGALFALHPVHTESVDWIAAVTDVELTFFYLLTFGFFLAVARPGNRRSEPMLAAMGVSFLLALLSKEQAMTLPALATVYEHFYRGDRSETSTSQKLARYGVLWLVGVAYVLFRIHFLGALAPEEKAQPAHPTANSALRRRARRPVRRQAPLAGPALRLLYFSPEQEPVRSSRSRRPAGPPCARCPFLSLLAQPRTERPLRFLRDLVVFCHAGSRPQRPLGGDQRFHRTLPLSAFRRRGVARRFRARRSCGPARRRVPRSGGPWRSPVSRWVGFSPPAS